MMIKSFPFIFFSCILLHHAESQLPAEDDIPRFWPMPSSVTMSSDDSPHLALTDTFEMTYGASDVGLDSDIIEEAIDYYYDIIFARGTGKDGQEDDANTKTLTQLAISVTNPSADKTYPSAAMDESYELELNSPISTLTSVSVWSAIRGLETFSQAITMNRELLIRNGEGMNIADKPRFSYRGLMLDTARHFQSVKAIKGTMDAMAQNKLNVLHLHLTDGEAFSINTETFEEFPLLSQRGAYAPKLSYTKKNFDDLVEYGRLKGIRLIPEVDVPAHMASWAQGYEELISSCPTENPHPEWPTYYSPADVTNERLYSAIEEIVSNLVSSFVDDLWHVGGDEPQMNCWSANENISKYMEDKNLTTINLYQMFEERYSRIVEKYNKSVTGWLEVATLGEIDPARILINVWNGNEQLSDLLAKGYQAVVSSNWYLNYGGDWTSYYNDDPMAYAVNNTDSEKANILGGQACMWASAFDTGSNMEPAMWPNAAAMAEQLWSAEVEDVNKARTRLSQHRCRMKRRGVAAGPIAEDYCGDDIYVRKSNTFFAPVNGFPIWLDNDTPPP